MAQSTKGKFRELKARKRKFGFEIHSFYQPEDILVAAEAIKLIQWMDIDALPDFDIAANGSAKFRVYTDNENAADQFRTKFC